MHTSRSAPSASPLPDRLAPLRRNRFVVLGRAGMDLYADPPGTRIEKAARFTAALGGSSANIAVALARQGAGVALVTCVSDDAVGRFCRAELARYGIDTRCLRDVGGEARNSLAVVETRAPTCQSVIYRNGAADFQMTPADTEAIDFAGVGGMIATGTLLAAEPSRAATLHGFARARAAAVPVIFDIDYRPYSWPSTADAALVCAQAAALSDIVIGNDEEFGLLAGGHEQGAEAARDLAAATAAFAVYKMGAAGARSFACGSEFRTGAYVVDALKPTGAGDGFMGGLIAGLAAGHSLPDAVIRGAATAAIVVTRVGCAPAMPDSATVDAFIARHGPAG
jgi:5-dehydro-2-deoxygluconokinase